MFTTVGVLGTGGVLRLAWRMVGSQGVPCTQPELGRGLRVLSRTSPSTSWRKGVTAEADFVPQVPSLDTEHGALEVGVVHDVLAHVELHFGVAHEALRASGATGAQPVTGQGATCRAMNRSQVRFVEQTPASPSQPADAQARRGVWVPTSTKLARGSVSQEQLGVPRRTGQAQSWAIALPANAVHAASRDETRRSMIRSPGRGGRTGLLLPILRVRATVANLRVVWFVVGPSPRFP